MSVSLAELVHALDAEIPMAWADAWDRVGLVVGDLQEPVKQVYVTLDPGVAALRAAAGAGANVVVSHHPPFLGELATITSEDAAGRTVLTAASLGIAIIAMHTNLDRSPAGADALSRAIGLVPAGPLERGAADMDLVSVYVPPGAREAVTAAMTRAGAGRIGLYESCSFASPGTGRFEALATATPLATVDGASGAPEERVEMIAPRGGGGAVAAAARAVHPYEEPVIVIAPVTLGRGAARLGRVCDASTMTLAALAAQVGERLGVQPRVWGDPGREVSRVAVANGSGSSLLGAALASGADVMVTGEVRYHGALDATASGLAIIEAGHDATEWPLVSVLADVVAQVMGDGPVVRAKADVGWWTAGKAE
ncbi:MAG: Nif3-like dinuclear metal center hexameric protein [Coriobacteriia bacterium]